MNHEVGSGWCNGWMYNKSAEQQKRKTSRDNASRGCLIRLVLLASDLFFCFNLKIALFQGGGRDLKLEKRPAACACACELRSRRPGPGRASYCTREAAKILEIGKAQCTRKQLLLFFQNAKNSCQEARRGAPPYILYEMLV
jgi:hypothetical protein